IEIIPIGFYILHFRFVHAVVKNHIYILIEQRLFFRLFTYFLDCLNNKKYPATPPISEAVKIPILACAIYSSELNAMEVINKDMVSPIEASKLRPNRFFQFIPFGRYATLSLTSRNENPIMPKTLPTNRPRTIPKNTFVLKSWSRSIVKETPAFAKAKMGITRNVTKGCIACSKRCKGGIALLVSCFTPSKICNWSSVSVVISLTGSMDLNFFKWF